MYHVSAQGVDERISVKCTLLLFKYFVIVFLLLFFLLSVCERERERVSLLLFGFKTLQICYMGSHTPSSEEVQVHFVDVVTQGAYRGITMPRIATF